MVDNDAFVTPGDKIATEEEFASGDNTFVENGVIYSTIIGRVVKNEGRVGVTNSGREIKIIGRDMLVIGTVTDNMKSVMFVKLDDINIENKDFLALKDGKIVAERPRMGGRSFGGERDRGDRSGGNRFSSGPREEKPCKVGDTILARVLYNDKDSYTLSLRDRETGVIYAKCELCGADLQQKDRGVLACPECGHAENRKISELYNNPGGIKKLFV